MLVHDGKLFGKYDFAWTVMAACCVLQAFGMGLVMNCASLFYVPVCDDLGFSRAEIATYMTGYFIGNLIMMPIAGHLLAKYDMRKLVAVAAVGLGASIAMMSTYTQIWQWQLSGFLVGLFGAYIFVLPAASLTGSWFIKRRGLVYGIVMACSGASAAILSPVVNWSIMTCGWRNTYLFIGLVVIVAILPCCRFFYNKPSKIGALPYGYDSQVGGEAPIMRGVSVKRAVRSLSFYSLFLFAGVAAFCHGGLNQHMPGLVQSIGYTSTFAAAVVSACSIGSILDKLIMGYLNDVIGVKRTAIIQFFVIMAGLLGMIFLHSPIALIVSAVLLGVQDSLMSVSLPMLIRSIFGNRDYTQIHAWIRCGVGIFGSFSGVIVGSFYDATGSYLPALSMLLCVCVIGIGTVVCAYRFARGLEWDSGN